MDEKNIYESDEFLKSLAAEYVLRQGDEFLRENAELSQTMEIDENAISRLDEKVQQALLKEKSKNFSFFASRRRSFFTLGTIAASLLIALLAVQNLFFNFDGDVMQYYLGTTVSRIMEDLTEPAEVRETQNMAEPAEMPETEEEAEDAMMDADDFFEYDMEVAPEESIEFNSAMEAIFFDEQEIQVRDESARADDADAFLTQTVPAPDVPDMTNYFRGTLEGDIADGEFYDEEIFGLSPWTAPGESEIDFRSQMDLWAMAGEVEVDESRARYWLANEGFWPGAGFAMDAPPAEDGIIMVAPPAFAPEPGAFAPDWRGRRQLRVLNELPVNLDAPEGWFISYSSFDGSSEFFIFENYDGNTVSVRICEPILEKDEFDQIIINNTLAYMLTKDNQSILCLDINGFHLVLTTEYDYRDLIALAEFWY